VAAGEEEAGRAPSVELPPIEENQPKVIVPRIITPDDSTPPRTVRPIPVYRNRKFDFSTIPVAIIFLALVIMFFLYGMVLALKCRRIYLSANYVFASLSEEGVVGPRLLSISVENQNTNIGRRNFHSIKAGFSLTIGGGNSDFLVFLTPLPPRLAKVYFDGEHCSFIPLKRRFFPEITSKTLPDCIGGTIRIKTEKNYDIFIRIVSHESPLQELNRLFNLVRLPGR
jgi:hypothetical protein